METQQIWSEFSEILKRFIIGKVKDKTVADDLLQEVFIRIHLYKENLREEKRLRSWVFTIADNTVNSYFNKHKELNFQVRDNLTEERIESDAHDARDCLRPLILNLPKKYRETLLLSEIRGLTQLATADRLNITLSAAKSRIKRGRELLKKGFMACCNYKLDKKGYLKGENKDIGDCKICG